MDIDKPSKLIRDHIISQIDFHWDGKSCVLDLKKRSESENKNYGWKQMEWIGFYFEHKAFQILEKKLGGSVGPQYGKVILDFQFKGVWDFKAHPTNSGSEWIYLNDVEAIDNCIEDHGHIAWVIACGEAQYDEDNSFKLWHDELKGKQSAYVADRINRGASSRRRKSAFDFKELEIIEFTSMVEIEKAIADGWLRRDMQKNQRNAGGTTRRAKYGIHLTLWREFCK